MTLHRGQDLKNVPVFSGKDESSGLLAKSSSVPQDGHFVTFGFELSSFILPPATILSQYIK